MGARSPWNTLHSELRRLSCAALFSLSSPLANMTQFSHGKMSAASQEEGKKKGRKTVVAALLLLKISSVQPVSEAGSPDSASTGSERAKRQSEKDRKGRKKRGRRRVEAETQRVSK